MSPTRSARVLALAAAGAMVPAALAVVAPAAHAVTNVTVPSHLVDLSETRTKGHHDFSGAGVRVWTESNDSQSKAAGYFDVNLPLADVGEPSMVWTPNISTAAPTHLRPSVQLKTDFDGDGTLDGILVGEPVYADGSPLYGNDWWLSTGSKQFVKDGAPVNGGGSGSQWHGTLEQWREEFPDAEVFQSGWSLGSGVRGDGTIFSITLGEHRYFFEQSPEPTTRVLRENDVDLSQTRANGSNTFLPNGVEVITTPADDGTNKAAGYFDVDVPLVEAGEPALKVASVSGAVPGAQLVMDFDADGVKDGILVGEPLLPAGVWWLADCPAATCEFTAPYPAAPGEPVYRQRQGRLAEWRVLYPDAVVLQGGWSLGSGAVGHAIVTAFTIANERYTFTGTNRDPQAGPLALVTEAGVPASVELGGDPDGDPVTYEVDSVEGGEATITDGVLEFVPAEGFVGNGSVTYTVSDDRGGSATATVSVKVTKAAATLELSIAPAPPVRDEPSRLRVAVTSTGMVAGGTAKVRLDGRLLGALVLNDRGKSSIRVPGLEPGKHTIVVRFAATDTARGTSETLTFRVRR